MENLKKNKSNKFFEFNLKNLVEISEIIASWGMTKIFFEAPDEETLLKYVTKKGGCVEYSDSISDGQITVNVEMIWICGGPLQFKGRATADIIEVVIFGDISMKFRRIIISEKDNVFAYLTQNPQNLRYYCAMIYPNN